MRIRRLILIFLLMATSSVIAQSPNDGVVRGSSYENSYFKFSYAWPTFLRPYDTASLHLPQSSPYANEFLLFSVRQGDEPYGLVMLAIRLNAVTPHSKGIRDGEDFLDRVARFNPEQHAVIVSRKHFTNAAGLVTDQLDYTENGEPSSAIAEEIGKFLIVFKCNAKSSADLVEMDQSAVALRIIK
ncbi:MAG: hypothetical protein ACLQLH_16745 [Terracidiphilus sp.]|jgi:hypothetical protein